MKGLFDHITIQKLKPQVQYFFKLEAGRRLGFILYSLNKEFRGVFYVNGFVQENEAVSYYVKGDSAQTSLKNLILNLTADGYQEGKYIDVTYKYNPGNLEKDFQAQEALWEGSTRYFRFKSLKDVKMLRLNVVKDGDVLSFSKYSIYLYASWKTGFEESAGSIRNQDLFNFLSQELACKVNKVRICQVTDKVDIQKSLDYLQSLILAGNYTEMNYTEYEEQRKLFRQNPDYQVPNFKYSLQDIKCSYEIMPTPDWFDFKLEIEVQGKKISLSEIRNAIIQDFKYLILEDNSHWVIPEQLRAKFKDIIIKGQIHKDCCRVTNAEALNALAHNANCEQEAQELSQKIEYILSRPVDLKLPDTLKIELMPHQTEGFYWLAKLQHVGLGACLADGMGVGKTAQVLAILEKFKSNGTSLVVVPTSLVSNWKAEAQKFTTLNVLAYSGTKRDKTTNFFDYDVVVIPYGTLKEDFELFANLNFNYLILDESQEIKNHEIQTTIVVKQLKSKHRITMTGTPIENDLMNLWSQMDFLNPGLFGTKAEFIERYYNPIQSGVEVDQIQVQKLKSLMKPIYLRRTIDVLGQALPTKTEKNVFVEMNDEHRELYLSTKDYYKQRILVGEEAAAIVALTKLRQLSNSPKLFDVNSQLESNKTLAIINTLKEKIQGGHKILIFSSYVEHLNLIKCRLQQENIQFCWLDGSMIGTSRDREIKKFENTEIPVFLMSLKAGGVGINLTCADTIFILDPWWNPAIEEQSICRAHRLGQTKAVEVYRFITTGSIEEKIQELQLSKKSLMQEFHNIETEDDLLKMVSILDLIN